MTCTFVLSDATKKVDFIFEMFWCFVVMLYILFFFYFAIKSTQNTYFVHYLLLFTV